MAEDEKLYWSLMDVCIEVEEGEASHFVAVDKILDLMNSYMCMLKIKEQRPL